jgi:hypothetical protein
VLSAIAIVVRVLADLIEGIGLAFRQRKSLEAEVLFLRRQLALYMERGVSRTEDGRICQRPFGGMTTHFGKGVAHAFGLCARLTACKNAQVQRALSVLGHDPPRGRRGRGCSDGWHLH